MTKLTLTDGGRDLLVDHGGRQLLRYVYRAPEAQLESPRPYFHPVRTLRGDPVTLYRPHDHVWHKGIALSLPNVGPANFWGGRTYLREGGYQQLRNNGSMRHAGFDHQSADGDRVDVAHRLDWITEQGQRCFSERRRFAVTVDDPDGRAWTLTFVTSFTNVSGQEIVIGSPTTQGRPNAGYGGLFWRGPRSFTGGRVYAPGVAGGDELMGVRGPWLAFCGQHDEHGRSSTLVFVDATDNPGHPTKWFVRSTPYACLGPAPFFDTEHPVADGETVTLHYAVIIADSDLGLDGSRRLAEASADVGTDVGATTRATSATSASLEEGT